MGNVTDFLKSNRNKGNLSLSTANKRDLAGKFKPKDSEHECSVKIKPKYIEYIIYYFLRKCKLSNLCPNELLYIILKYSLDKSHIKYNKTTLIFFSCSLLLYSYKTRYDVSIKVSIS